MSETWVINENATPFGNIMNEIGYNISFISNEQHFIQIGGNGISLAYNEQIIQSNPVTSGTIITYIKIPPTGDAGIDQAYRTINFENPPTGVAWIDQAYRTVTFETAPTGDLLTWLQANAVKQVSSSKRVLKVNNKILSKAGSGFIGRFITKNQSGEIIHNYEIFPGTQSWEYPVQDGGNLTMTQVFSASQSGSNLTIE